MGNSIEEDIKILEELRIANENCIKNAKNKDNPFVAIWEKQNIALEHILSDYKRVLKENEELKYKYDKALSDVIAGIDLDNSYIPIQKVKDKIEELNNNKENYTFDKLTSEDIRRTVRTNLQELIEVKGKE